MTTGHHAEAQVAAMTSEVRARMRTCRISAIQMARLTGIPRTTLDRRLNGRGRPWLMPELAAVARELGTTPSTLIAAADARLSE